MVGSTGLGRDGAQVCSPALAWCDAACDEAWVGGCDEAWVGGCVRSLSEWLLGLTAADVDVSAAVIAEHASRNTRHRTKQKNKDQWLANSGSCMKQKRNKKAGTGAR